MAVAGDVYSRHTYLIAGYRSDVLAPDGKRLTGELEPDESLNERDPIPGAFLPAVFNPPVHE